MGHASRVLIALVAVLPGLDASAEPCTEAQAVAVAREATRGFCTGVKLGCSFETRAPDAKGQRTILAWLIHSYDENGKPRFMPDGLQFVDVSKTCEVVRVWAHEGQVFPPPSKVPPSKQ